MTKIINGKWHVCLDDGGLLAAGDVFFRDGVWQETGDIGRNIYSQCPREYWRPLKETTKNRICYALTDPCCNALNEDFREGLFTISDGQLTIMVGPMQLTMHVAYCPFCGTEINAC